MGLLNYTTTIETSKSISEITSMLAKAGAQAVLTEFDEKGAVIGISFRIQTPDGILSFKLPANITPVVQTLNQQVLKKVIPRRYLHDHAQAARVAWRITKDWLEAQLALIETRMVSLEQVLLPYAVDSTGATVYERYKATKFMALAAPSEPVKLLDVQTVDSAG